MNDEQQQQETPTIVQPPVLEGQIVDAEPQPTHKSNAGRPTVMTPEVVAKLRQGFLMGYNDREACIFAEISRDSLYDYIKLHPEFADSKEEWKENPVLKAKSTLYNALDNKTVAAWYLERKRPDEFATRKELTGINGEAIAVKVEYVLPEPTAAIPEQPENSVQADAQAASSVVIAEQSGN